jgi:hypothetical protein
MPDNAYLVPNGLYSLERAQALGIDTRDPEIVATLLTMGDRQVIPGEVILIALRAQRGNITFEQYKQELAKQQAFAASTRRPRPSLSGQRVVSGLPQQPDIVDFAPLRLAAHRAVGDHVAGERVFRRAHAHITSFEVAQQRLLLSNASAVRDVLNAAIAADASRSSIPLTAAAAPSMESTYPSAVEKRIR